MEWLLDIIKSTNRNKNRFIVILSCSVVFLLFCYLYEYIGYSLCFFILSFVFFSTIVLSLKFYYESKTYCLKQLKKMFSNKYLFEKFEDEILKESIEIQSVFEEKDFGIHIFFTSKWFIFISPQNSIIEQREAICSIERGFNASRSESMVKISFKNEKAFVFYDRTFCEEIIEFIKNEVLL